VPTALSAMGTQLYKSLEIRDTTSSTKYPIANPHVGKFRVEVSRYLANSAYTGSSAKAWYLLADPADLPVIERMRMTPEERQAEIEARRQERLATLTPEQKQFLEEREARIEAMTPTERRAYWAGRRLAGIAWALRRDVAQGVGLAEILAAVEPSSRPDVDWLIGELKKGD